MNESLLLTLSRASIFCANVILLLNEWGCQRLWQFDRKPVVFSWDILICFIFLAVFFYVFQQTMLVFLIINVWCPVGRLCTQRYNEIKPFECIYFCAAAKASLIQCKSIVSNAYILPMPNVIRIQYKTDNRFDLHFDKHTHIQNKNNKCTVWRKHIRVFWPR